MTTAIAIITAVMTAIPGKNKKQRQQQQSAITMTLTTTTTKIIVTTMKWTGTTRTATFPITPGAK